MTFPIKKLRNDSLELAAVGTPGRTIDTRNDGLAARASVLLDELVEYAKRMEENTSDLESLGPQCWSGSPSLVALGNDGLCCGYLIGRPMGSYGTLEEVVTCILEYNYGMLRACSFIPRDGRTVRVCDNPRNGRSVRVWDDQLQ